MEASAVWLSSKGSVASNSKGGILFLESSIVPFLDHTLIGNPESFSLSFDQSSLPSINRPARSLSVSHERGKAIHLDERGRPIYPETLTLTNGQQGKEQVKNVDLTKRCYSQDAEQRAQTPGVTRPADG